MKANPRFLNQPKSFWANIRLISEKVHYTVRGRNVILVPTKGPIQKAFKDVGLSTEHLWNGKGRPTAMGRLVLEYFQFRADVLNTRVVYKLMNAAEAKATFQKLKRRHKPQCPIPWNKQKGKKKAPAYLTGIVNILIEAHARGWPCNFSPRTLTSVTRQRKPLRTLARWVDGAFPSAVNPIAIWEVKEYYYTTTFGSRVADGVYESLLDGMELEELREHAGVQVKHYLMVDDKYTWWSCGKSYLCRMIDMLHMGYVDEILFGKEVLERLPALVKEWVRDAGKKDKIPSGHKS